MSLIVNEKSSNVSLNIIVILIVLLLGMIFFSRSYVNNNIDSSKTHIMELLTDVIEIDVRFTTSNNSVKTLLVTDALTLKNLVMTIQNAGAGNKSKRLYDVNGVGTITTNQGTIYFFVYFDLDKNRVIFSSSLDYHGSYNIVFIEDNDGYWKNLYLKK